MSPQCCLRLYKDYEWFKMVVQHLKSVNFKAKTLPLDKIKDRLKITELDCVRDI